MNPSLPLQSIRVLDFSRLLPGPYASMLLADLGAEVIKIETPRLGDYAREAPPEFGGSGMFHLLNRGKKSLALNYRNRRGREIFLELVKTADVVLESFKPGAMAKWGFDYASLKTLQPGLVYCSISGYGQDGPYREKAGHDINYTALAGLVGLNGLPGGTPHTIGIQIADLGGGMAAAMSILAALFGRSRTGEGAYLDVSMLDLAVSWALPVAGGWFLGTGSNPAAGRLPLTGGWPCYNTYETQDGTFLSLGALEDPFWAAFCQGVGRPDLLPGRFDPGIFPEMQRIFKSKTREHWLELFSGVEACLEPVNTIAEMLAHPQVTHRRLVEYPAPGDAAVPATRSPIPPGGITPAGRGPALGEHTRLILQEVRLSPSEIEELANREVINCA